MQKRMLGRTNRRVFPLWVRGTLSVAGQAEAFFEHLQSLGVEVLDITPSHGIWGFYLREYEPRLQIAVVVPEHLLPHASDSKQAVYAIQAHLIEVLCAVGRERCDYYFLNFAELPGEAQLSGALEALELARQEGQIGAIGLAAYGNPLRTLALWRTHDAFEVVLLPNRAETLQVLLPEARARRVGVVVEQVEGIDLRSVSLPEWEHRLDELGADALLIAGTILIG